jgi:hypothetical protein
MTSLASKWPKVFATMADAFGSTALIGSDEIKGFFKKGYHEQEFDNGTIVGFDISFRCLYSQVSSLQEGDDVDIRDDRDNSTETFIFRRFVPVGGDAHGKCFLDLGRPIA